MPLNANKLRIRHVRQCHCVSVRVVYSKLCEAGAMKMLLEDCVLFKALRIFLRRFVKCMEIYLKLFDLINLMLLVYSYL